MYKNLKIYDKTEFTFDEVINTIEEGDVYSNDTIAIKKLVGNIQIQHLSKIDEVYIGKLKDQYFTLNIDLGIKYKLVSSTRTIRYLHEVEHKENGPRYLFRTDLPMKEGNIVICDTKFGKTYGKVVGHIKVRLQYDDFLQYKEIIKVVK